MNTTPEVEGEGPIQLLQDITDREALTALSGGLDINSLFLRDVQNKELTSYDALLEMIKRVIINKDLKDHRNRANQGLPPPQIQKGMRSYFSLDGPPVWIVDLL